MRSPASTVAPGRPVTDATGPGTALVTGTSTGLGRELALQLAERGWEVVATVRDTARVDDALRRHRGVLVLPLDVTDPDAVRSAVAATLERFGSVEAVVNNAGYAQRGTLEEVSLGQWRAQYETNVFGVVTVLQEVLPSMRERDRGHVVNVSSMGGHVSLPTMSAYTSSKFALEGLTEGLAQELAHTSLKVTLVEPAGMSTPFHDNALAPATTIDDYDGARAAMTAFASAARRSDVRRGARAVAEVVGSAEPPLRLALGAYALELVRGKLASLGADYDRWEAVSAAAD